MSYISEIQFDAPRSIESEHWKLELLDNENVAPGPCLVLMNLRSIPVTEIELPLGSLPARIDLARSITRHAPRHVAYELARLAPSEWVAPDAQWSPDRAPRPRPRR